MTRHSHLFPLVIILLLIRSQIPNLLAPQHGPDFCHLPLFGLGAGIEDKGTCGLAGGYATDPCQGYSQGSATDCTDFHLLVFYTDAKELLLPLPTTVRNSDYSSELPAYPYLL